MTLAAEKTFAVEGIRVPDSSLAREITELVRDTESGLLFHHSSRVAGKRRALKPRTRTRLRARQFLQRDSRIGLEGLTVRVGAASTVRSETQRRLQMASNSNRGVVYLKPGHVEVQKIDFPTFRNPAGKTIDHAVILKVVTTNICGSDQHMVRGRTTAPAGMVLGHEITGEVIEKGRDVEYLDIGDLVSVPFNVACGRCRTCREGDTGVCLHVNSDRAGGAYGYVDMGGWIGGQADYVMVPYADFNLLKFPDKAHAMEKIRDLTCLSDILPTGFHGAVTAKVGVGSTV